jgi:3D (Asp-Asp-Asp) domain-containing protein
MSNLLVLLLLLTPNLNPGNCQPQSRNTQAVEKKCTITATAYCLKGHTSSGPRTREINRCIALSRDLVKSLGLLKGNRRKFSFDKCMFGAIVVIDGLGEFTFADIMPPQWKKRVDIWHPTKKACYRFGLKRGQKIWVKVRTRPKEIRLARLNR